MPFPLFTADPTTLLMLAVGIALLFTLVGYALSTWLSRGKLREISEQLQLAQQTEQHRLTELSQHQEQLKTLQEQSHQQQIAQSRLEEQIHHARITEQRLNEERHQDRVAQDQLHQQREALIERLHQVETQRETALADLRSGQNAIEELKARLQQTEQALLNQRREAEQLREQLADEGKIARSLQSTLEESRKHFMDLQERHQQLETQHRTLNEQHRTLDRQYAELNTSLSKREEHFQEQLAQLADNRKALTQEFENLANKIFEEKGKTFSQTSQASIDTLLKPFREQIEGFQRRINEVHDASLQGNTHLNAEIRKVLDIGLKMSQEANNLTSALKGDSQQRGAWGEAQLRRTLEMSGLVEETHYEAQTAFKDTDGKHKQTDYLIKLPDGKHIIIDSKVSLVAYDRAVSADTPEAAQLAMKEHVNAVRKHIDDLASKDYTNLVGMRSPNFVLMFMPIEPAYIDALKNNKDLFEYGYKKGIVLVSHTTLIPILRTVSNLWMIERSNAEAREISERAGEIYNQVCLVATRLNNLGSTLKTTSNHYNDTVRALVGQQGLYGKVERFDKLSAKVSKQLPKLDATHLDFETERLALIVQEIQEPELEHPPLPDLTPLNP